MNKTLLGSLILFATAIGFLSFASAEPSIFENTPDCRDPIIATEVLPNGTEIKRSIVDCKFYSEEIIHPARATAVQNNLTDAEIKVLEKIQDRDERPPEEKPEEIPDYDDSSLKTLDAIVAACERMDKNRMDESDKELCREAQSTRACAQGVRKLGTIQETRTFLISTEVPDPTKSWDYLHSNQYLVILHKAGEECKATWLHLYRTILSAEYEHKVWGVNDFQSHHREHVTTEDVFPSQKLPPGMEKSEALRAENMMCKLPQLNYNAKKDYGCFKDDEVIVPGSVLDYTPAQQAIIDEWKRYHKDPPTYYPADASYGVRIDSLEGNFTLVIPPNED